MTQHEEKLFPPTYNFDAWRARSQAVRLLDSRLPRPNSYEDAKTATQYVPISSVPFPPRAV